MRFVIGCSGAFALVIFVIGFVVSLFFTDASWSDRLTMAVVPAIITFIAVLLLASHDSAKRSGAMRSARKQLLARADMNEDEFVSSRSTDDAGLLLETRKAISRFFEVPTEKIGRDIQLIQDLHVDNLEPSFQFYVVNSVIASQANESEPFTFSMAGLETIDDLTVAIRTVLDGFNQPANNEDQGKT